MIIMKTRSQKCLRTLPMFPRLLLAPLALLGLAFSMLATDLGASSGVQPGQFLKEWLILKPIPVASLTNRPLDEAVRLQGFAKDWLIPEGGEARVEPRIGMKVRIAGSTFQWQRLIFENEIADLPPKNDVIAYAWTEFTVPERKSAFLGIGSDDSVKVWLNGKWVHEQWANRGVRIDDDLVPVEFQPGTNQLLLKIQNGYGKWGFTCRVLSEEQAQGPMMLRANIESPGSNTLTDDEIKTMLRDCIDTDRQGVGLVVGIVDEHGLRVISHGKMDGATSRDVDGDTVFEIGSITKVFTGLLLQDMVERGEMKLDDPVQKYLPDTVKLPAYHGKQITLLHLATHTSGLPRDVDNVSPVSWRNPGAGYTVGQFYDFLSHCELQREPGARRSYSNLGVDLLGHAIALKAGKDYETLVEERICRPLGMNSTRVIVPPELKSRLAIGHAMPGAPLPGTDFSVFPGAGGLRSTANDLLKFISAYMGLTPSPLAALMEKAKEPHSLESGETQRLVWSGDGTVFEHSGLTFGFMSDLAFNPGKRRGIVILSNCANNGIAVASGLPLLEGRSAKPPRTAPMDAALYDRYAGQYKTGKGGICIVRREGERLMFQWPRDPGQPMRYASFEMFPQSESVFYNNFWGNRAAFVRENGGQAVKLFLSDSQDSLVMTRISTQLPETPVPVHVDSRIYDGYVGQYRHAFLFGLIHFGPTFNINRETDELGDHLVGYVSGVHPGAASGGLPGSEIYPASETTFFHPLAPDNLQVTFVRNKQGKATHANVNWIGTDLSGDRVSDQPAK